MLFRSSFLLGEQAAFAGEVAEGNEFRLVSGVEARTRRGPGGRTLRMANVSSGEAARWLTDEPVSSIGFVGAEPPTPPGARVVPAGQMQQTTVDRLHDGKRRLASMLHG